MGPTLSLLNGYVGRLQGIKRPRREADHSRHDSTARTCLLGVYKEQTDTLQVADSAVLCH